MPKTDKTIFMTEQVNIKLRKNIDTLLASQRENGSINAYCCSRVLESTLTLHLLRNQSYQQSKQKQIENYLISEISKKSHHAAFEGIEEAIMMIAEQVISNNNVSSKLSIQLIDSLLNREQGRKELYFGCLFAEVGVLNFSDLPFSDRAFQNSSRPLQTWAKVMMCSIKILYCYGTSKESQITKADKDFLKEKLLGGNIYENNVLTQIVGLIALSKVLAKQDLEAPIDSLMNWQQQDGGFPLMTGLDIFVTPLAGLAIQEALPSLPKKYQESVQEAVTQMAKYLASEQAENGGWSYMTGTTQTDMDDSGLCCALLAEVDANKFDLHLQRVEKYKSQMHNKDGGFPTYIKDNPSTPSMTAAALHGIAELLLSYPNKLSFWKDSIFQTLQYLSTCQKEDGTFERRWSNAETHAMFRVAIALRCIQKVPVFGVFSETITSITSKMEHYLHKNQNVDGGWGFTSNDDSDIISTAYAILCCTKSNSELATRGMKFIISIQQENNEVLKYRPELLGPRPVPYDIPLLPLVIQTHAFAYFLKVFG